MNPAGVGVVNGQPLPSTQYTRAAPALPGGGGANVGNVGMGDSAVHLNRTHVLPAPPLYRGVRAVVLREKVLQNWAEWSLNGSHKLANFPNFKIT